MHVRCAGREHSMQHAPDAMLPARQQYKHRDAHMASVLGQGGQGRVVDGAPNAAYRTRGSRLFQVSPCFGASGRQSRANRACSVGGRDPLAGTTLNGVGRLVRGHHKVETGKTQA